MMRRVFKLFLFYLALFNGFAISQPSRLDSLSAAFAEVAKKAEPAVVNIDTKTKSTQYSFNEGSGDTPNSFSRQQSLPVIAVGSGFILDPKGFIITNAHVIEDALKISVKLQNGEQYIARVIGADEETDLAVLKIDAGRELPVLKFGDSGQIEVGEWVIAIGSPFGLDQTVTAGIISKVMRQTAGNLPFQRFIQTDAAINKGNSGGPLLNMKGEVIGVNSQIATVDGNSNGIGFALPANQASYVYNQIITHGKVRRGYLGVILESVKAEFASVYGLAEAKGAVITEMRDAASPASKGGLKVGDIITEFDGAKVENSQDLINKVALSDPDKNVSISYLREMGMKLEKGSAMVKLSERQINQKSYEVAPIKKVLGKNENESISLGVTLTEITPAIAKLQELEGNKGLIVKEIANDSILNEVFNNADRLAIKPGDVIQRINRIECSNIKSFNEVVSKLKKGDAVVLHTLSLISGRQKKIYQARIVQFTIR